eukprot:jgi/Mesen1/5454/ME000273S04693
MAVVRVSCALFLRAQVPQARFFTTRAIGCSSIEVAGHCAHVKFDHFLRDNLHTQSNIRRGLSRQKIILPVRAVNQSTSFRPSGHRYRAPTGCEGACDYQRSALRAVNSYSTVAEEQGQNFPVVQYDGSRLNSVEMIGRVSGSPDIFFEDSGVVKTYVTIDVKRGPTKSDLFELVIEKEQLAEAAGNDLEDGHIIYVKGGLVPKYLIKKLMDDEQTVEAREAPVVLVEDLKRVAAAGQPQSSQNQWESRSAPPAAQRAAPQAESSSYPTPTRLNQQPIGADARSKEELWEDLYHNPQDFWDNRLDKRNPRAPDFKHKKTGEALWLSDRELPGYIAEKYGHGS